MMINILFRDANKKTGEENIGLYLDMMG